MSKLVLPRIGNAVSPQFQSLEKSSAVACFRRAGYFIAMIAWAIDLVKRRRPIRIRQPQNFVLFTDADREKIDATFDEGGRIVTLIVHTRLKSLRRS